MISEWLDNNFSKIVQIRRWLHQHPEVGFDEHKTSKYCQSFMVEKGYDIIQTDKMKTGFYCDYGSGNGPTLAVRCDLDALPIQEVNTFDNSSKLEGLLLRITALILANNSNCENGFVI